MNYTILHISDSDKHWSKAVDEYLKRLRKSITIDTIKPTKNWTQAQIIQKETKIILEKLEKKYSNYSKILLSKSGEQYSTEDLWFFLNKSGFDNGGKTVFIIWWPYGFDENKLLDIWVKRISFGKITLPHWLAKLTLLEQIYRIWTIESGKKYHY
jgi:23S rRNA (pseudouridine1915-N3)-methyltransferase